MIKKGNLITYSAEVFGFRHNGRRKAQAMKCSKPKQGIFVGYSYVAEGKIEFGYHDDPNYFIEENRVKVAVVIPLKQGNRYLTPVKVLPEDMEAAKE